VSPNPPLHPPPPPRLHPASQGIVNRLAIDEAEVEERVFVEAITNQYESREAVKYAGEL
jgi:hypothetical protein